MLLWVINWVLVFLLCCMPMLGQAESIARTKLADQLLKAAEPGMRLHSLYEMDASKKISESLADAVRGILRKNKISYRKLRSSGIQVEIEFRREDQIEKVKILLQSLPQTIISIGKKSNHLVIQADKALVSAFNLAAARTEIPWFDGYVKCAFELSAGSLQPMAVQISNTNKIALYVPIGNQLKGNKGSVCIHQYVYGYRPFSMHLIAGVYDSQIVKRVPLVEDESVFSVSKQFPNNQIQRYLLKKRVLISGENVLSGRRARLSDGTQSIQLNFIPWLHAKYRQGQEVAIIRDREVLSTAIVHSQSTGGSLVLRLREKDAEADRLLNDILTAGIKGVRNLIETWE